MVGKNFSRPLEGERLEEAVTAIVRKEAAPTSKKSGRKAKKAKAART